LLLAEELRKVGLHRRAAAPNALNDGQANFPEFHMVYIEPGSYGIYQKTGQFPEGTIFLKELQLLLPAENPDGSRTELSGRGFFSGKLNGADVTLKVTERYAETGGWAISTATTTSRRRRQRRCVQRMNAHCHMANAKKDEVCAQFYSRLDH
jgi:Cytochrome P460